MSIVWQIAAGDSGRDYSRLFLSHDVMFLGPGRYGAYDRDKYRQLIRDGREKTTAVTMVEALESRVQPGDIVLLRRGYRVIAVGIVADEGYLHDSTFDDVYGWDLEHTRRVIWQDHLEEPLAVVQSDGGLFSSRRQIPTFTRVKDRSILNPIEALLSNCRPRELKVRPEALPAPLTLEQLGRELFARGLANSAVEQVQRAIERQRRLLAWYGQHGKESARPDEHEVVAHMVLPLLLALGWSEQLLAVEWHKVDLAGFVGTPTVPDKCVLVCEAKGLWHGLQDVLAQAKRYVKSLALGGCRKILVTQGGRFYLYRRTVDGSWPEDPDGYFNVERIRINHIAPAGTDAVETLMALTPAGILHG